MDFRSRVENDQDPGGGAGLHLADHELSALGCLGPVDAAEPIAPTIRPDSKRVAPIASAVTVRQPFVRVADANLGNRPDGVGSRPDEKRSSQPGETVMHSRGRTGTRRRFAGVAWDKSLGSGGQRRRLSRWFSSRERTQARSGDPHPGPYPRLLDRSQPQHPMLPTGHGFERSASSTPGPPRGIASG